MPPNYKLILGEHEHELEVEEHDGHFRVRIGDDWHPIELQRIGDSARYSMLIDHQPVEAFAEETPHGFHIVIGARTFAITVPGRGPGRRAGGPEEMSAGGDAGTGEWVLTSPMAGVVQEIMVQPGDEVEANQVVAVVEAMKMQNDLRARRAGTVKAVYVTAGQRVDQGAPLLVLV
jgi:biotin carboxyl carrier protein